MLSYTRCGSKICNKRGPSVLIGKKEGRVADIAKTYGNFAWFISQKRGLLLLWSSFGSTPDNLFIEGLLLGKLIPIYSYLSQMKIVLASFDLEKKKKNFECKNRST